ncbi:uncharacterized protein UDID_05116 [Ustilago sp. UG-2017a]|nr:uncharacterized protein UDID_05116 [Ustilago sp. UG-2017a]
MPITPRNRTASASGSPAKVNSRRQSSRISITLSDEEEPELKKKLRSRPPKAKVPIEVVDDEDDDEDDDDEEAGDEFEVEVIRDHRPHKGAQSWDMEYLIKWKGWSEADNTWEPETNLPQNLIDDYWKKQPSKSQPKKFEQVGKQKAQDDVETDENDIEEIEAESDEEDEKSPRGKAKNSRGSTATKRSSPSKSTPKRGGANKRPRTSTSSRRRALSDEEEVEDEEEEKDEEDAASVGYEKAAKTACAMKKISDRFLYHYLKKYESWENQVRAVNNMQRNADTSQLESEVEFKESSAWTRAMEQVNEEHKYVGKGPSIWIANDIVNKRCPQKVIKFYEQHVRFSNPRSAH